MFASSNSPVLQSGLNLFEGIRFGTNEGTIVLVQQNHRTVLTTESELHTP